MSIYKLHVDTIFTMNCCESTQKTNLKTNNAAGLEEYSFGTISIFTVFNEANDLLLFNGEVPSRLNVARIPIVSFQCALAGK